MLSVKETILTEYLNYKVENIRLNLNCEELSSVDEFQYFLEKDVLNLTKIDLYNKH